MVGLLSEFFGPFSSGVEAFQGRQSDFSVGFIAAGTFAGLFFGGGKIEDVVDDLEGFAEAYSKLANGFDLFGRGSADSGSHDASGGDEGSGFAAVDGGECRDVEGNAFVVDVVHLTSDEP